MSTAKTKTTTPTAELGKVPNETHHSISTAAARLISPRKNLEGKWMRTDIPKGGLFQSYFTLKKIPETTNKATDSYAFQYVVSALGKEMSSFGCLVDYDVKTQSYCGAITLAGESKKLALTFQPEHKTLKVDTERSFVCAQSASNPVETLYYSRMN
jgi:hypothetical protein